MGESRKPQQRMYYRMNFFKTNFKKGHELFPNLINKVQTQPVYFYHSNI